MANDPTTGPVSDPEGGTLPTSDELRPDSGLTRSEIINKFGEELGRVLLDAGYASLTSLMMASDEELLAILDEASFVSVRAVAPYMPPPEGERELPELSGPARGEPAGPRPASEAGTPDPSPRFGIPGAVSTRIGRMKQAQAAQQAQVPAPPPVAQLEARIEVVEDDETPTEPLTMEDADAEAAEGSPDDENGEEADSDAESDRPDSEAPPEVSEPNGAEAGEGQPEEAAGEEASGGPAEAPPDSDVVAVVDESEAPPAE